MTDDDWGTMTFFEDNFTCEACESTDVVPAVGSKKSKILIVAEYPGKEEIKAGKPMVGAMGNVLRTELGILGFDLKKARRMNLWQHPANKNMKCQELGIKEVIKEAKDKDIILLLGDECVKIFLYKAVTKVAGLKMKSKYFSAEIVIPCPNPAIVFKKGRGVGEIRLAFRKFVEAIDETTKEM